MVAVYAVSSFARTGCTVSNSREVGTFSGVETFVSLGEEAGELGRTRMLPQGVLCGLFAVVWLADVWPKLSGSCPLNNCLDEEGDCLGQRE